MEEADFKYSGESVWTRDCPDTSSAYAGILRGNLFKFSYKNEVLLPTEPERNMKAP